ncbi:unnamed protein product [Schistosoma curassoni]|uniref:Retrotransposon gag protein n=1 Tax=Schistosoma curassoni TaxID=6186 RepID=A0A183KSM4_9TREM|nr:unnamed protein product [Schistosoma curassoni]
MGISWIQDHQSILQNKEGGNHNECYPMLCTRMVTDSQILCIQQDAYRRQGIPLQDHIQSFMSLTESHYKESDRSYLHQQNVLKVNRRRENQRRGRYSFRSPSTCDC